jgi:hypothetical protein
VIIASTPSGHVAAPMRTPPQAGASSADQPSQSRSPITKTVAARTRMPSTDTRLPASTTTAPLAASESTKKRSA